MLYTDLYSLYKQRSSLNQQCQNNSLIFKNLYDILRKTIPQSMNTNLNEINSKEKISEQHLTSKEKRAVYMSQLRGSIDSEYRRIERENNARAMRKKRLENPLYREHERRQNRVHMAEMRRINSQYRQREHMKNRHRMTLKRRLIPQTTSKINETTTTTTSNNTHMINTIYQTLENNLQSSHISFIPYQSNLDHDQRLSNTNKQQNEYELLQQIDEYCRQQETGSSSDSNSRSIGSTSSY